MRQVWEAGYRPNGGQVFMFPLMAVYAPDYNTACEIAGPDRTDPHYTYGFLALDSAEAQNRLGVWGNVDAADLIMRGD